MENFESGKLAQAMSELNSEDLLTQNEGVQVAIELGAIAVPELLSLLAKAPNRAQVMYALAQIGDRRAVPAFTAGLLDADEQVRAYSAQGLARAGDPQALQALLQTLDDAPDELHLDITPSVQTLGGMGLKAVPFLLDLLLSEKEMTRLHAQRALESIVAARHGFVLGKGYPSPEAREKMRAEWHENGDYAYSASPAERAAAVAKWREWLAKAHNQP